MSTLHFILVHQLLFQQLTKGAISYYALFLDDHPDAIAAAWTHRNGDFARFCRLCDAPGIREHRVFFLETQQIQMPDFAGHIVAYPDFVQLMRGWNLEPVGTTPGFRTFATGTPPAVNLHSVGVEVIPFINRGWVPVSHALRLMDTVL